jgi:hypothetical protein
VKREGKEPRIILDVRRQINQFIDIPSVKLTSLERINENAREGDWFATTDMASGYYHLRVNEAYVDLFGFCWAGEYYHWRVCFLGLKDMVLVFTKFVQPIISYARKHGHEASAYLDDLHALARTEDKCLKSITFIREVMMKAGIVESI